VQAVFGQHGGATTAADCTANFGRQGFTQALALEGARQGITGHAVCPGTGDTARMDGLGRGETWQQAVEHSPLGRPASDEAVAGRIALLCRSAAAYMPGQAININGGVVMWEPTRRRAAPGPV
jgi:NAD(P)-dependent dehydrogenase (short-subunit alcohol dehydrogenase family)